MILPAEIVNSVRKKVTTQCMHLHVMCYFWWAVTTPGIVSKGWCYELHHAHFLWLCIHCAGLLCFLTEQWFGFTHTVDKNQLCSVPISFPSTHLFLDDKFPSAQIFSLFLYPSCCFYLETLLLATPIKHSLEPCFESYISVSSNKTSGFSSHFFSCYFWAICIVLPLNGIVKYLWKTAQYVREGSSY